MTGSDTLTNTQNQLSDASMEALGLQHQPFVEAPASGELFSDSTTTSLLTDINTALYGNDDVLLVLGIEGSGRSTLLRQLASSQQSRIACFSVKGSPRFDTAHLFGSVLEAFKTPVPSDLKDALDALIPNLQGTFERYNRFSTIVIDNAEQVPVEELTKLLSGALYLNGHEEPLLRVLLASTPDFEDRLPEALPQGAEIRYASLNIEPFDTARAESYMEFRLNQAGYFDEFPFTESDTQSIMEASGGFPGHINEAAALNLNSQHGLMPEAALPPELMENATGGNMVKMFLGGFACLLILAGLFMFTRSDEGQRSPAAKSGDKDYRTVETVAVAPADNSNAQELEIVDAAGRDNANQLAANTTDVLNQNSAATATEPSTAPSDATEPAAGAEKAPETPKPAPKPAPQPEPEPAAEEPAPKVASAPAKEDDSPAPPANPEPNSDEDLLGDSSENDDVAANATPATEPNAQATGVLESPTWILVQDPTKYTVQMSASTDRASVESFMRRNDLPAPNSVFAFDRNGATWYALVHGLFSSVPEARDALKKLPEGALRNQPWIRKIGQLQSSLKDQN